MEIAVLIPCLNEEKTIEKVITDFKKVLPQSTIYVCDNNSSDKTSDIALRSGAIVFQEPSLGKGNAVRTLLQNIDADCYLICDGDDTYPAESAMDLCSPIINHEADLVFGDRFSTYFEENKRPFHGIGNRLVRGLVNLFWKKSVDVMTGYRALSRRFVVGFPSETDGFEVETEMTVFALAENYRTKSVPILYRDRPIGSESKLNTYIDGAKILWTIAKLRLANKKLSVSTALFSKFF